MPKSGSREPEGQLAEWKHQPAEGNLRSGACRKAEAVSPKANPPSGNLRSGRQKNQLAEGNSETVRAEKRKPKPEGQLAEWQPRSGACRKAEVVSPKVNPPSGKRRNGRRKRQPDQRQLRSGACRKAEVVSPKANSPRATPKRRMPKSGSREPEGQPGEGNAETEGDAERRKPPKASVRHPQIEAAKRGVGGAVPTHLPIQSKNAIVTP